MPAPDKSLETPDDALPPANPSLPDSLGALDDEALLQRDFYAEHREEERRAARLRRGLLIAGAALATVIVPLGYLRFTGRLSRNSVQQVLSPSAPAAQGIARPKNDMKSLDAVGKDLQEYTNTALPDLAPLEDKAVADFASVTGPNFRSNAQGAKVIREKVIPEFKEFLGKAGAISPKTEEVRDLHRLFMASEQAKGRAYALLLQGISQKDNAAVRKAQQQFAEANRQGERFTTQLKALAEKHGVQLRGIT